MEVKLIKKGVSGDRNWILVSWVIDGFECSKVVGVADKVMYDKLKVGEMVKMPKAALK